MQTQAYLDDFAILKTQDLSEARASVAEKYCDHRLDLVRGRKLNVRHNHVRGTQISLNVLGYGGDVRINPGELRDFYLLQIPIAGTARIRHRGETVDASIWTASILNPDRPSDMEWSADCTKVMVQIDSGFLNRVAREDLGAELPGSVRFDPTVDFGKSSGQALRDTVLATLKAYETGAISSARPNLSSLSLERHLASSLLSLQPSNVSQYYAVTKAPVSTRPLKRAIDFIQTQYHRDLRLDEIASASGLHPRTLQLVFQSSFGMSPIAYLKVVRLNAARYRLCKRRNRESVTDVAFGCGFSHLGRFSRDYRALFGHAPSDAS
ncbi:AraC family transcriptional regulator [Rhodobacteraceae bacterium M385]|nr:AraC family transcriptional regulator [Rhodobacteraceae bacterium M385]